MITITPEALFDLLQTGKAEFYTEYQNYDAVIGNQCEVDYGDEDDDMVYPDKLPVTITKEAVIALLMNRVFIEGSFKMRVGL